MAEKIYFHTNECSLVRGRGNCDCGAYSGKGQEDVPNQVDGQGVNNATPEKKSSLDKISPPEKMKGDEPSKTPIGKFLWQKEK